MYNTRESEYYSYLHDHIHNVRRTWEEILSPIVLKIYPDWWSRTEQEIEDHDSSKYSEEEFDAYCNYFYPTVDCPKDEDAFDLAWLHHQKLNPHHWQYWVLIRDGGKTVALDMPISSVVSMLADWHSFSVKDPNSTAYNWYTKNKGNMRLSINTRTIVEKLLEYLKEPLR